MPKVSRKFVEKLLEAKADSSSWLDAQVQAQASPETFRAPSAEELGTVAVGTNVKICNGSERFWVQITEVGPGSEFGRMFTGVVNNDLVGKYPYSCGDSVSLAGRNIYAIA